MWVSERCHCYACASIGNCYCGDTGPLQFEQIPVKHQHWIINKLPNMLAARNGQVQLGRGPQRGAQRLRPSRAAVLPGTPRFYPRWEKHFLPSRTENLAHLQPSRTGFAPPPPATCGSSAGDQQGSHSSRTGCAQTSSVWLDIKSMIKK